jgi:hypothetical protein
MLFTEVLIVCSENDTKHIKALCGQNYKYLYVKPGGT